MRHFTYQTVDVFTDRRFGGNPLAVFTDARGLSDAEMGLFSAVSDLSFRHCSLTSPRALRDFLADPSDIAGTAARLEADATAAWAGR